MSPSVAEPVVPRLRWSGWTDRGRVRPHNEDSFLGLRFNAQETQRLGKIGEASLGHTDFAFAVSDGMGGAKAGEYASNIAVEKITTLLPRSFAQRAAGLSIGPDDVLAELFSQVHRALAYLGGSYEECDGMETTLSLCWFTPGWMYFGHVGDSRIYYLAQRDQTIKQISQDDTYVGWLYRTGKLNEREARTHPRRNVLQKALGGSNQFIDPQLGAVGIEPGDRFLICSDGLTEGLYDHHILDLIRQNSGRAESNPARELVLEAVRNDGRDNTTALVIEVA
ncbi:MAG TPA: protein phosphatase 2C domain-containing protein [Verrucomicrobiota bacterium]|nr:protein phosphatase 2C domain-containing protein [Verrucomicrobiota bacterium]HNT14971.1 protein phosphatase 2C domain-containing protein [Verrucomicrobiota bacterium]